jgi:hypothetical protein
MPACLRETRPSWVPGFALCGALLLLAGCAVVDQVALWKHGSERERIFKLYGDCLTQSEGELLTLARYCGSVAEIRHGREREAALQRCPLAEYFPCLAR